MFVNLTSDNDSSDDSSNSSFRILPRLFKKEYKCYTVAMFPGDYREDIDSGGKILMPPSALEYLTFLSAKFPMLFKLSNKQNNKQTHCGVLEFVANEGAIYIPYWMMQNLLLENGDQVKVESVSLEVATFSKFQPQCTDFLKISNPKAVLEHALRNFFCLTTGDVIAIKYNEKVYELLVLETKPSNAVKIIECDLNVDFATPVGYQEPTVEKKDTAEEAMVDPADLMPEPTGFVAFNSSGYRLDGKSVKDDTEIKPSKIKAAYQRGIPDYDYTVGSIQFFRNIRSVTEDKKNENQDGFKAFSGTGSVLNTKLKEKNNK